MLLQLKVYTDDTLQEVKRVAEADELVIPYRVSCYLIKSLDSVDIENEDDLIKFISGNIDKLDKVVKATFGLSELELDCVNTMDLIGALRELYAWITLKLKGIDGGGSKNV